MAVALDLLDTERMQPRPLAQLLLQLAPAGAEQGRGSCTSVAQLCLEQPGLKLSCPRGAGPTGRSGCALRTSRVAPALLRPYLRRSTRALQALKKAPDAVGYRAKHYDLSTEAGRKAAWRDYWWNDHAFLRARFQNAHQISPRMWRTNQPSPDQLRRWRDEHGVRTIFNLRGDTPASFTALEKEACHELGLDLHFLKIESRGAPDPVLLKEARELFANARYPALMHCKSGADRAGVMSVFYLYCIEGVPLAEARKQLSNKYLHVSAGKTGILGFFWDEFARAHESTGIDFWTWLDTEYDRDDLKARFKPDPVGAWLVDRVLGRE